VRELLAATADPDGHGLLLRGHEFTPWTPWTGDSSDARQAGPQLQRAGPALARADRNAAPADPELARLIDPLLRLARLADAVGTRLLDHPDPRVRRSAAVVAARAYPLLLGLDG
jgi:hypothetical protein